MAEMISRIQVGLKSFDGFKKLIEAAPAWLEEASKRECTQAEKLLFAAFMEIAEEYDDAEETAPNLESDPLAKVN